MKKVKTGKKEKVFHTSLLGGHFFLVRVSPIQHVQGEAALAHDVIQSQHTAANVRLSWYTAGRTEKTFMRMSYRKRLFILGKESDNDYVSRGT